MGRDLKVVYDPEARAELHLKLCEKYMREAEELLEKKDYVQASGRPGAPRPRWSRRWPPRKAGS